MKLSHKRVIVAALWGISVYVMSARARACVCGCVAGSCVERQSAPGDGT